MRRDVCLFFIVLLSLLCLDATRRLFIFYHPAVAEHLTLYILHLSPSSRSREASRSFFFLLFFPSPFFPFSPLPFSFHSPFSFLFLLSAFPFSPLAALFHVRLNCSARRIRFQVINNMWATAPRNLYFEGLKPPKYRKFRQSYQHFIVEILIFVEKCVTIDV